MNSIPRAPGLAWNKRSGGVLCAYWRAPRSLVIKGYPIKSARLWAGGDPSEAECEAIAARCRRLQQEASDWISDPDMRRAPKVDGKTLRRRRSGKIYFVRYDGRLKIGFTMDIAERLRQLRAGTPNEIEYLGSMTGSPEIEKFLHWLFRDRHVKGEWFEPDDEMALVLQKFILPGLVRERFERQRAPRSPGAAHGARQVPDLIDSIVNAPLRLSR